MNNSKPEDKPQKRLVGGVSLEDDGINPYISSEDDDLSISSASSAEILKSEEIGLSADATMQAK